MRWEDYWALFLWIQCDHKGLYKGTRMAGESETMRLIRGQRKREKESKTESEGAQESQI